MMSAFVKQFYDEAAFVPPSILLQKDLDERAIIEQWLRGRRGGQKVVLQVPTEARSTICCRWRPRTPRPP